MAKNVVKLSKVKAEKTSKATPAKQPAAKAASKPDRTSAIKAVSRAAAQTQRKIAAAPAKPTAVAKPTVVATTPAPALEKQSIDFKSGDFVVYPAHGVGRVEGIETHHIAGMTVTLYAINFEKDRMILKVPVVKAKASGLRRLSSRDRLKASMETLQGRARIRRVMWSRRAQEYEAKINSGDPVSIAEVVRDLYRNTTQQEQSYSERQIYQAALERLAREVAAVEKTDEAKATAKLESVLAKAA